MKNKILKVVFFLCLANLNLFAEELNIKAANIKIDKDSKILLLEQDVVIKDIKNNILLTEKANYSKDKGLLKTLGKTKIITDEGFTINGTKITFDNIKGIISSDYQAQIKDKMGNIIFVEMFNYDRDKNIFFSKGKININDVNGNKYKLSEVYINEKQEKIIGTDAKVFINQGSLKPSEKNDPRIFANSVSITKNKSELNKAICTYCENKGVGKSPPWTIKAKKIEHNSANKTIYYDSAVLKIFDFPVFYFPKFFHPDPSVERRSGFLPPSIIDSTNLGSGVIAPYFWSISKSRDLTITPKIYTTQNPLVLAEYRQAFKDADLIVDAGLSGGYENTIHKNNSGSRDHFFSKFIKNFNFGDEISSQLEINLQNVSDKNYLKIYDINTTLIDKDLSIVENSLSYNYVDEDSYFGFETISYEDKDIHGNNRFEYLLPYLTFDTNLGYSEKYGNFDLNSKLRVKNYDVNKQTEFFVNDLNWKSLKYQNNLGIENQFFGLLKTVNYNAKNTDKFKNDDINSEFSGAIGYLAKLPFFKTNKEENLYHLIKPKLLLRYAPGHMRKLNDNVRLNYDNVFSMNRTTHIDVLENGLSASIGLEYQKNKMSKDGKIEKKEFEISVAQIVNEEENLDRPSPLNQKLSDLVGKILWNASDSTSFTYNYALDESYKTLNYSELGADLYLGKTKLNISYLEERNHFGAQEYVKTDLDYKFNVNNKISLSAKRNLLVDSSEYYNLSYEYTNDCLKAGILFRREFYTDKDLEADNALMFTLTFIPFSGVNSPKVK